MLRVLKFCTFNQYWELIALIDICYLALKMVGWTGSVCSVDKNSDNRADWRTIALNIGYFNTTSGYLVSIATIKTPHTRSSHFAYAIFLPNDLLRLFSLILGTISILIAKNIPISPFEGQKWIIQILWNNFIEMWLWPFFIFCVNTLCHNRKWISAVLIGHLTGHWCWITTKAVIRACYSDTWFKTFCSSLALLKIHNSDFFTFIRFQHLLFEHIRRPDCPDWSYKSDGTWLHKKCHNNPSSYWLSRHWHLVWGLHYIGQTNRHWNNVT